MYECRAIPGEARDFLKADFGSWLARMMECRRPPWSDAELIERLRADATELSAAQLSEIRDGTQLPGADLVMAIAHVLGRPAGEALLVAGHRDPRFRSTRMDRPLVIGVTGGTGAGKTVVATGIVAACGPQNAVLVGLDWYIRGANASETDEERRERNYDVPAAYDLGRVAEDIATLRSGRRVDAPRYDFERHARRKETASVEPRRIVVVEGLFLFHHERVRDLLDLKLFVEASGSRRYDRRVARDVTDRGRSESEIRWRYYEHAEPGFEKYIAPTRQFADLIIPNDTDDLRSVPVGISAVVTWALSRCMR